MYPIIVHKNPTNLYCPITFSSHMNLFVQYSNTNIVGYDRNAYLHHVLENNHKEPMLQKRLPRISKKFYFQCCNIYFENFHNMIHQKIIDKQIFNIELLMLCFIIIIFYSCITYILT